MWYCPRPPLLPEHAEYHNSNMSNNIFSELVKIYTILPWSTPSHNICPPRTLPSPLLATPITPPQNPAQPTPSLQESTPYWTPVFPYFVWSTLMCCAAALYLKHWMASNAKFQNSLQSNVHSYSYLNRDDIRNESKPFAPSFILDIYPSSLGISFLPTPTHPTQCNSPPFLPPGYMESPNTRTMGFATHTPTSWNINS